MLQTALTGVLLGWSIAWPPGPINAEMIRRGLARGFWSAWSVGLGACSADFLWALGVGLAAGRISSHGALVRVLSVTSIALLFFLAASFLRGAWIQWKARQAGLSLPVSTRLQSARGGWLVGFLLALTSPWGLAFWLAVLGRQSETSSPALALALAGGVIAGACLWGLVLSIALQCGARFATPMWQIVTQASTGLLMLYFAGSSIVRLWSGDSQAY